MPALNWTEEEMAAMAAVNRPAINRALVWWKNRARRNRKQALEEATPERPVDRKALDAVLLAAAAYLASLSRSLQRREMELDGWQLAFADEILPLHLASAAAGAGGMEALTLGDTGRLEERMREQLAFLLKFAIGIEAGRVLLDGRVLRRSEMYGEAGRGSYYDAAEATMARGGFDLERSIRTARDSCHGSRYGCVEQEMLGWVPVRTLVKPGGRLCLTRCRCYMEFQNSKTGETVLR